MSRATPQMREFAERLVAYEARGRKSSASTTVAFHVCEKLRPHLAALTGKAGFSALLSRALALAAEEAPALRAVRVQADGTLAVDGEAGVPDEGGVILLARLLGLLETFIGESLTLRKLREVWPRLSFSNLYFGKEN